jgi:hypothetical protein
VNATLLDVQHGSTVRVAFELAEGDAHALVPRLNEAGQGALRWVP